MEKTQPPDMGKPLTREQVVEMYFGHLDEYFEMMMGLNENMDAEAKQVCELAVRAFINDISHNGLPTIRRERYNREFVAGLMMCGLRGKAAEMVESARGGRKI
jgi:ADP-dependent phosphofructokinase/glucokinase